MKSSKIEAPVPKNYTCYRCGQPGHWIKNCPSNLPPYSRVKRCTGIPRTFLVKVNGPETKGALLMSSGDYVVPLINHLAYKEAKDEEPPPVVVQDEPVPEPEAKVPDEVISKDPGPVQNIPEQPSQQANNISDSYYHEKDNSYGYERGQMTGTGSHIISYFDKSSCDSINSSSAVYQSLPEHDNNYHSAAIPPPFSSLLSTLQVFSAQPPPPGISPFVTSHVTSPPPPPPAAPFIPFLTDSDAFVPHPLESRNVLQNTSMPTEKSIDDQMEVLQRRLEQIKRNSRENDSRNRQLGTERRYSRSPSRSRFYSTSKSRTPSPTRSSSRSYHDRSIDDQMEEFQRRLEEIHRKSRENDSRNRSRGVESHQSRSRAQLYSTYKSRTPSPTHSSSRPYSARSIDERMEEFQRRLQKIHRNSRESDSRNRSVERHQSRSSSRTKLYSTSKSRTPSPSCSSSRPYRARSRTPFSSRSRSRSRSRSWSKKRSYTRSECHARTDSSSRTEASIRRHGNGSRDRVRSPNSRSRSRSYSPKGYQVPSYRNSSEHGYTYSSEASHHSRHLHSVPSSGMHSRPGEQYPYGDRYLGYKYPDQRYEREKSSREVSRYEKRSEYRHQEEVPDHTARYIDERSKDYKPRNRPTRDPQKE